MRDEKQKIENLLEESFERWDHVYAYGASDPNWADGVNLNLIRNHIMYYRRKLEEMKYFPQVYSREVPPKMDNDYIANPCEIRKNAQKSLEIYKRDANYQYLIKNAQSISETEKKNICFNNVIECVKYLEYAIRNDLLVDMRRHEQPNCYLDSFKQCRQKISEIRSKHYEQPELNITEDEAGQLRFA